MSGDGHLFMKLIGLILGVALGLLLFGRVFLDAEARDKYELYCLTAFTHQPHDANGCDHEARQWHAP